MVGHQRAAEAAADQADPKTKERQRGVPGLDASHGGGEPTPDLDQRAGDVSQTDGKFSCLMHSGVLEPHRERQASSEQGTIGMESDEKDRCTQYDRIDRKNDRASPALTRRGYEFGHRNAGHEQENRAKEFDHPGHVVPCRGDGSLRAVAAHEGDEQAVDMDKGGRIHPTGERGETDRKRQRFQRGALLQGDVP